jgi:hypothetical protein
MLYRGEPEYFPNRTPSGLRANNIELMEREFNIDNVKGNKFKQRLKCNVLSNPYIMYYLFLTIIYGYKMTVDKKITPVYEYYQIFIDKDNNIQYLLKKFIDFCESGGQKGKIPFVTGEIFFKIEYILKDYAFFQHSGYPTLLLDITDDNSVAKEFAGYNGIIYKFDDERYKEEHSWVSTINIKTGVTNINKTSALWSWENELYSDSLYLNKNIVKQKGYVIYVPYKGSVDKYFQIYSRFGQVE